MHSVVEVVCGENHRRESDTKINKYCYGFLQDVLALFALQPCRLQCNPSWDTSCRCPNTFSHTPEHLSDNSRNIHVLYTWLLFYKEWASNDSEWSVSSEWRSGSQVWPNYTIKSSLFSCQAIGLWGVGCGEVHSFQRIGSMTECPMKASLIKPHQQCKEERCGLADFWYSGLSKTKMCASTFGYKGASLMSVRSKEDEKKARVMGMTNEVKHEVNPFCIQSQAEGKWGCDVLHSIVSVGVARS